MELQTSTPQFSPNVYTQLVLCNFDKVVKDSINSQFKKNPRDERPNYASIDAIYDAIVPELKRNGLQPTAYVPDYRDDVLVVKVTHGQSGTSIATNIKLLNMSDMQKFGASRTYGRKALAELVGVAIGDDDDDGNTASAPNQVTSAFTKSAPVNVTPEPIAIAKPEQTLSETQRMALTLELHDLWKVKEGSVRAEETDMSKRAILLFKNDLAGVNDSALIKLKDYLLKMQSVIIHKPIA